MLQHDRKAYVQILLVGLVIALGFFAAARSAQRRKGEGVCVVCSFWGSVDNLRPNLPAVVGHGLLLVLPAINAPYCWKKTNWILIHTKQRFCRAFLLCLFLRYISCTTLYIQGTCVTLSGAAVSQCVYNVVAYYCLVAFVVLVCLNNVL